MKERELAMKDAEILGRELIEIKRLLETLKCRNEEIRKRLLPLLPKDKPIFIDGIRIRIIKSRAPRNFIRQQVLDYITETFDEVIAEAVDKNCTTTGEPVERINVYLDRKNTKQPLV